MIDPERQRDPVSVVEEWVARFNAADPDGLAELYHRDAVNHQVMFDPVEGRHAIREMFRQEFAAHDMVCIPDQVHDAGDVVILEWQDPTGRRGCGFFEVRAGRIMAQRGYWDRIAFQWSAS